MHNIKEFEPEHYQLKYKIQEVIDLVNGLRDLFDEEVRKSLVPNVTQLQAQHADLRRRHELIVQFSKRMESAIKEIETNNASQLTSGSSDKNIQKKITNIYSSLEIFATIKNLHDHIDEYVIFKNSIILRANDLKESCEEQLTKLRKLETDFNNKINKLEEFLQDAKDRNTKQIDGLQLDIKKLMQNSLSQSEVASKIYNRIDKQDEYIQKFTNKLKNEGDKQASKTREQYESTNTSIAQIRASITDCSAAASAQDKEQNIIISAIKAQIEDQSQQIYAQSKNHKDIVIKLDNHIKSQSAIISKQAECHAQTIDQLQNQISGQSKTIQDLALRNSKLKIQINEQRERITCQEKDHKTTVAELKSKIEQNSKYTESQKQEIAQLEDKLGTQNKKIDKLLEIVEKSTTKFREISKEETSKLEKRLSKKLTELDKNLAITRENLEENKKLAIDFSQNYQNGNSDLKSQIGLMNDRFHARLENLEENLPCLKIDLETIDGHIDDLFKDNARIVSEQSLLKSSVDTMGKSNESALQNVSQKLQASIDQVSEKVETNRKQIHAYNDSMSNTIESVAHDLESTKDFINLINIKCVKVGTDVDQLNARSDKSVEHFDILNGKILVQENTITNLLKDTQKQYETINNISNEISTITDCQKKFENSQNDLERQIESSQLALEQKTKDMIKKRIEFLEKDTQKKSKDEMKILHAKIEENNSNYINEKIELLSKDVELSAKEFLKDRIKSITLDLETKSNNFTKRNIQKLSSELKDDIKKMISEKMNTLEGDLNLKMMSLFDKKINSLEDRIKSENASSIKEQINSTSSEIQTINTLLIEKRLFSVESHFQKTTKDLVSSEIKALTLETEKEIKLLEAKLNTNIDQKMNLAVEEKIASLQSDIQENTIKYLDKKIAVTIPDIQKTTETYIKTEMDNLRFEVKETALTMVDEKINASSLDTKAQIENINASVEGNIKSLVTNIEENITKNVEKQMGLIETVIHEKSQDTLEEKICLLSSDLEKKLTAINDENTKSIAIKIEDNVNENFEKKLQLIQSVADEKLQDTIKAQMDAFSLDLEKKVIEKSKENLECLSSSIESRINKTTEIQASLIESTVNKKSQDILEDKINTLSSNLEKKITLINNENITCLTSKIEDNMNEKVEKEMKLIKSNVDDKFQNAFKEKMDLLSSDLEKRIITINDENMKSITSNVESQVNEAINASKGNFEAKIEEKICLEVEKKLGPLGKTVEASIDKHHELDNKFSKLEYSLNINTEKVESLVESQCADRISAEIELARTDTLMSKYGKEISELKELMNSLKKEDMEEVLDNLTKRMDDKGLEILHRVESLEQSFIGFESNTKQLVSEVIAKIEHGNKRLESSENSIDYKSELEKMKMDQYFEHKLFEDNVQVSFNIIEQAMQAILETIPHLQDKYSILLSSFIEKFQKGCKEDAQNCEESSSRYSTDDSGEPNSPENLNAYQYESQNISRFYGTQNNSEMQLEESPLRSRFNLFNSHKNYETRFYDTQSFESTSRRPSSSSSVIYHAKDGATYINGTGSDLENYAYHNTGHLKLNEESYNIQRRPSSEGCASSYYNSIHTHNANYLNSANTHFNVDTFSTDSWEDTSPNVSNGSGPSLSSQQYINKQLSRSLFNQLQTGKYSGNSPRSVDDGATFYATQRNNTNFFNQPAKLSDQFSTPAFVNTPQKHQTFKSLVSTNTTRENQENLYVPVSVSKLVPQQPPSLIVDNSIYTGSDYSGYEDRSVSDYGSVTLQH